MARACTAQAGSAVTEAGPAQLHLLRARGSQPGAEKIDEESRRTRMHHTELSVKRQGRINDGTRAEWRDKNRRRT